MRSRIIPFLVTLVVTGCATSGSAGGTTSPGGAAAATSRPSRGSLNHITRDEVEAAGPDLLNAFQLIESLRPSMLRSRASSTANEGEFIGPVAYVDDVRLGAATNLRQVMRGQVLEIRYFSASDATTRWGTGHPSGAIQVITKR